MQIVESIKFEGRNLDDIFKLECVDGIIKGSDNDPVVTLEERLAGGRRYLRRGDYLCKLASGMWRVLESNEYHNLIQNGKE